MTVISWLKLTTHATREIESLECLIMQKNDLSHFSRTLLFISLYPWNVERFQREFWERNPRENQDWLIHNLRHLILQIPLLSPSPLTYPWEVHLPKILISPHPYQWGGLLVLGKQFGDNQFTWLMQWAYCGIREAKEDTVRLNAIRAKSLEGIN